MRSAHRLSVSGAGLLRTDDTWGPRGSGASPVAERWWGVALQAAPATGLFGRSIEGFPGRCFPGNLRDAAAAAPGPSRKQYRYTVERCAWL